jgi:leucyl-tRNA synthetase
LENLVLKNEKVQTFIGGQPIRKIIFVADKLMNIVV